LALISACDPFPILTSAPAESLFPGTYVLDQSSFEFLKARGFNDFSAEITLNPDKTFRVARMPHIWVNGIANGSGYDNCSGTWSIGKDSNRSRDGKLYYTYNVTLLAGKPIPPKGSVVSLGISGPKGKRKDCALAVSVFFGDFYDIWFVRRSR
jgi:hypothetical protein